jgi:tellurite resistance protein
MPTAFTPQDALVATMILTAAADGALSQAESDSVASTLSGLPVFRGFDQARMGEISAVVVQMLAEDTGVAQALDLIAEALPPQLAETAVALACDVAAADGDIQPEEAELLRLLRRRLHVDRLVALAIERGARARHARL